LPITEYNQRLERCTVYSVLSIAHRMLLLAVYVGWICYVITTGDWPNDWGWTFTFPKPLPTRLLFQFVGGIRGYEVLNKLRYTKTGAHNLLDHYAELHDIRLKLSNNF